MCQDAAVSPLNVQHLTSADLRICCQIWCSLWNRKCNLWASHMQLTCKEKWMLKQQISLSLTCLTSSSYCHIQQILCASFLYKLFTDLFFSFHILRLIACQYWIVFDLYVILFCTLLQEINLLITRLWLHKPEDRMNSRRVILNFGLWTHLNEMRSWKWDLWRWLWIDVLGD